MFFAGCNLRQADGQALGQGIEYGQGVDRLNPFAQTILCFKYGAVHADIELGQRLGLSLLVGLDVLCRHRLAKRPGLGVIVGRLRLWDRVLGWHEPMPNDLFRLFQLVNGQCASGRLRNA